VGSSLYRFNDRFFLAQHRVCARMRKVAVGESYGNRIHFRARCICITSFLSRLCVIESGEVLI